MVSVIVPVYKSEKTLERCVDSLLRQDYEDVEILLIVDGPPDGSGILAEKLAGKDDRIRVINQKNQGVSKARNRGIAEARGAYIRFLDSDDYVSEDSISSMLTYMEETGCDMVIAGYDHLYFGDTIQKLPHMQGTLQIGSDTGINIGSASDIKTGGDTGIKTGIKIGSDTGINTGSDTEQIKRLYADGFLNMPWNKLYRRDRISEGFPTDRSLGEDLLFNLNYIRGIRSIGVLQHAVCEYIQDDRGTTLSTRKRGDRIQTALSLYEETTFFFKQLCPNETSFPFLDTKLVTTFLDEVEELGFSGLDKKEKKETIVQYADALRSFLSGMDRQRERKLRPKKPDYAVIYFFLKRNQIAMTQWLVRLRTGIVRMVRKGRRT